ncbi:bifunctional diguanylate cyclase/phosphodiesterase [Alkalihalobacterium chitinilyticum]|uniref:EAL domain-containing protein n=1 Tax=Alkalihalobacterium chitinilyticum TaxID=2980103 RepID=A0ABT5VJB9_9BACI|nr:bifunctional diguanylate cyclase/phosphodiesterase [Alkalihalobacterium chitinilyticum]MDE5415552.1 EAL domain-containing protein [Alkalihalobacterium chitinilyticum]
MDKQKQDHMKLTTFLRTEDGPYKKLFYTYPEALFLVDTKGNIIEINQRVSTLTEYDSIAIIGKNFKEFILSEDVSKVMDFFQLVLQGKGNEITFRIQQKSLNIKYVEVTATPIKAEGEVIGVYGVVKDITNTIELEHKVVKSEERFQHLIQYSSDVIGIIDPNGVVLYESPACEQMLGFEAKDLIGTNAFALIHPDDLELAKDTFAQILTKPAKASKVELRIQRADGSWADTELVASNYVDNPYIRGVVVNYRDLTEHKKSQREVEYLAYHDQLTGMYNREYFKKRLMEQVDTARKTDAEFPVFLFDLDGFKFINDTLGHHIGDQLLCEVAERLVTNIQGVEVLARIGGDEFGLLQTTMDGELDVTKLAKQVIQTFKEPFYIHDYELYITCSIGVSTYPDGGTNIHKLMKNADAAMYQAKDQGKNQYEIYTPSITNHTYRIFTLKNHLRKAIEFDEFLLHFQPRINSQTEEIVGVEALLRWYHPTFGHVPPNEFIPVAEEDGQIITIGEWVLDRACEQNKQWQVLGLPPIKMSVNFSVLQFLKRDLVEIVRATLDKHKLEPIWLEIEITESAVLENNPYILDTIMKLQGMGITIALDDFGTGYSSLSYLRKYKIDTLKIDRSFVMGIPQEAESFEITKTIISLAQALKMNIVAEGVETAEQLKALSEVDCNEIQGYFYSKPLPALQMEEMLRGKTIKRIN